MKKLAIAAIALATAGGGLLLAPAGAEAQQRQFVNIGTAGIGGNYYPAGGFICNLVHRTRQSQGHNIRCTVESTAGSVGNLRAMRAGDLDIAFSQSDWQYHAYRGTDVFKDAGPDQNLRFVLSVHSDVVHLVARKGGGIQHFKDLKGKRVNTGNVGSGTEATVYLIMQYMGIDPKKDLALDSKLTSREQASALCDNKIDAFVYPTGVPAGTIQEATNSCDTVIGTIDGPQIDKMLQEHPYFAKEVIPASTYRGQDKDVQTFGPVATLVATTRLSDDIVYNIVKAVFDNFEDFKAQSTVFANITREKSVNNGRSIPFHPGAERYYREVGLVK